MLGPGSVFARFCPSLLKSCRGIAEKWGGEWERSAYVT